MDRETFRSQILSFSSAINRACTASGSVSQIHGLNKYSSSHFKWYFELDVNSKERVRDFMIQLDKMNRIDPEMEKVKTINEGAIKIMESIVKEISALKPNLAGKLYRMGSVRNGLKINQLDEIDFTYQMNLQTILGKNVNFKKFKSENGRMLIFVDFDGEKPEVSKYDFVGFPADDPELDRFLSLNGSKDVDRYKSAISKQGNHYTLNTEAIAYALFIIVNEIVPNIKLPTNWRHGGYNYPYFSGVRLHIPAFQLQFAYQNPNDKRPTVISFDFAPVLKLPENYRYICSDIVDDYLDRNSYIKFSWQRLERGTFKGGYYSLAEEAWLETYSFESIAKVVIRVCKAIQNLIKMSSPKYITKVMANRIVQHRHLDEEDRKNSHEMNDFMMSMLSDMPEVSHIPSQSEFAMLIDVYENIGCYEYIPSYIFKKLVLTVMVLDGHEGRKWNENDIPDIVVTIFMVINDIIMSVNQATPLLGSPTEKEQNVFSYSIESRSTLFPQPSPDAENKDHIFLRENLKISLDQFSAQDETVLYQHTENETKDLSTSLLYEKLHEAVKDGKCEELVNLFRRMKYSYHMRRNTLDLGISSVVSLLKQVAEGKSTAFVDINVDMPDEDLLNPGEYLITKSELEERLK